jgi:hypothetical protein
MCVEVEPGNYKGNIKEKKHAFKIARNKGV